MKLLDYVNAYQACLSGADCDELIAKFEACEYKEKLDIAKTPKFTQVNINDTYPELVQNLVRATLSAYELYRADHPETQFLPPPRTLETFRVKRYRQDTDEQFKTHIDVADYTSAKRYIAFLFYLNDDFDGGETEFEYGQVIHPQRGKVLIFPPTWQFPHAGLPVTMGTKYIMSTYLTFA